jgi:putative Mg2+ transporter-C (MgtC) family protein
MGLSSADAGHLVIAAALTYLLGFERDLRGAAAGDRIFALVGTGAGVVGIIAVHGAPNVLAGAITGIGFIGGGLVFRQAEGRQQVVMGITTAAAIFAATAIGAAAGQGRLLIASVATALALFVLEIRHIKFLNLLDGHRWAYRFRDDEPHAAEPDQEAQPDRAQPVQEAQPDRAQPVQKAQPDRAQPVQEAQPDQ